MPQSELLVEVQSALSFNSETEHLDNAVPSHSQIKNWAAHVAQQLELGASEVTIRLVHEPEMCKLNSAYRSKQGPTNVLSFRLDAQAPEMTELLSHTPLGDVIICHEVVIQEAKEQGKSSQDHYAHMITHGILHLCGYDHIDEQEAEQMEALEVSVLALSHIANPYQ